MKITLTETITRTYEMEVDEAWPAETQDDKGVAVEHIIDACKSVGFECLKMKMIDDYCERSIEGILRLDI